MLGKGDKKKMKKKYEEPLVEVCIILRRDVLLSSYDEGNGDNLFDWDLE